MKVYITTITIYSSAPFEMSDKEFGYFVEGATNDTDLLCLQEDKVIDTLLDDIPSELREVLEDGTEE